MPDLGNIKRGSKPAPFKRPMIEIGKHGRSWKTVEACSIKPGDIVADVGLVTEVTHTVGSIPHSVEFTNIAGNEFHFGPLYLVKAFVLNSALNKGK